MSKVERHMNAYYFGFDPTGCDPVDAILEAVAIAGKGAHHTSEWTDPLDEGYRGIPSGMTLRENIQRTAMASACRIAALEAENAQLAERLRAADYDRERAFMALPITPNPQMAFGGLIYPHAVRVADEFAFRTAQNQEHERAIARLEAQLADAKALLETARPYLRGIRSTNPAPFMDSSAYPGWLDEPRTAAKKMPAEWWAALDALRTGIDALLTQERTDEG